MHLHADQTCTRIRVCMFLVQQVKVWFTQLQLAVVMVMVVVVVVIVVVGVVVVASPDSAKATR
jgi:maltodextrin utilization protein YvdJ